MNKKYRITIEKYAQKDIESIYNYICDNLVNKEAAIKLLNKINEKFDSIALFPKSAPLLNNDYVRNKNIRKLLIDNYIAFYEVDDINKEIKIIRIIYGMQNYVDVLQRGGINNRNFFNNFIKPQYRERLLYELKSSKTNKRDKTFTKLLDYNKYFLENL